MSISSEIKNQFLKNFQNRVLQGRQLLQGANHQWASRLYIDLYYQIEKTEWLVQQKKRQLIMIISNSWWIYLNSLTKQKEKMDVVRYLDAYRRFFDFLSQLDEFDLFNNFWMNLLKQFIKTEDLSIEGITKFINSFSYKVKQREDNLKLIELQMLLMYLRKTIFPSDLFSFSLKFLGEILYKLEPSKKALLLYVFMENINIKYQIIEEEEEGTTQFVQIMNKILANRLPSYLKEDFINMRKISVNERNFSTILSELEELIYYLNNIGEYSWIPVIIRYIFTKIKEYKSIEEAINYVKRFIDFSVRRARFKITYEIYDFLDDFFQIHSELGYNSSLVELWVEACKKFVNMKEKKYMLLSMDKLNNHLKIPQTPVHIFHYYYTCNYVWQFRSRFFSLDKTDFWRMIFYRALFEEKDVILAQKIVPYLGSEMNSILTDLNSLYSKTEAEKSNIYSIQDDIDEAFKIDQDFILNQIVIRITSEGAISLQILSKDNRMAEGRIKNEFWNDTHIMEIYYDTFLDEKKYDFNLTEFGKLLYIFLPKVIRNLLRKFNENSSDDIPHIYFVLDNMTVPFGLTYDEDNLFMLKFSNCYKIGEPLLVGALHEHSTLKESTLQQGKKLYNALVIEAINDKGPLRWNEEYKNKILLFPFPDAYEELNHITHNFNVAENVDEITILSGVNSTREKILLNLSQNNVNVIHFVGNIFYSEMSPKDSYFLTNDNDLITFSDIKNALDKNRTNSQPILFFNAQFFNGEGKILKKPLKAFGEIITQFNYNRITGIVTRCLPLFNEDTRNIIANFYANLFNDESQGIALLKALQQGVNGLVISSFMHFGKPWKKLKE